jgi:hypothetical protein
LSAATPPSRSAVMGMDSQLLVSFELVWFGLSRVRIRLLVSSPGMLASTCLRHTNGFECGYASVFAYVVASTLLFDGHFDRFTSGYLVVDAFGSWHFATLPHAAADMSLAGDMSGTSLEEMRVFSCAFGG